MREINGIAFIRINMNFELDVFIFTNRDMFESRGTGAGMDFEIHFIAIFFTP